MCYCLGRRAGNYSSRQTHQFSSIRQHSTTCKGSRNSFTNDVCISIVFLVFIGIKIYVFQLYFLYLQELKAQLNSLLEQKIANPLLDFSSGTHSSKLIQAIIELICNEDTSQIQHFPNIKGQGYSLGLRHHDRYFHYPDGDSEDEGHDDSKFQ